MSTKFKNILITGASSGIGEALALHYAAAGVENLFLCGRNEERLNKVAAECAGRGAKVFAEIAEKNGYLFEFSFKYVIRDRYLHLPRGNRGGIIKYDEILVLKKK